MPITSRDNPKIKQARSLRQRKQREATGLFLVEGIRHVGEAVEAAAPKAGKTSIEYIVYSPDLLTSVYAFELIHREARANTPCYAVNAEVFASLAEKENPQGILAVVRQQPWSLAELNPLNFPWACALVAPQDPGNTGAILRTIDAVKASGLILLDSSADPYHPSTVRASMGALFWYPVVCTSFSSFSGWARSHSYQIYGTSAHGSVDYRQIEQYPRPAILLMGSEREGLSQEQSAVCDALIRLPMEGRVSSLNLAVAAGIMLYEMYTKQGETGL
ncbi:MAG: RNA methyltransferase [Chloroflexota bacterium]|nr:MAG: RNA methyltransferase [Chloroflexota bacterium]